ncbi:MFS transporter [Nocardia sp. CDC153]|uniref:MFS transporter n=1 Tax=Nocardia sp. CDC153 TaxID=3112167 RepID=UPI002DBC8542|nr:MFS transporter [Nocardia sp. CDC153]MEC3954317.1 MFS transporter [Nocardia sp. CDC153]
MNSRLITLALGTFTIGIDAFVTAGLVTPVSKDLGVSTSAAGQLVTVFALSYAILSPVLATATARLSRKRVLLIALSLFVLGNVVTALAGAFGLVLASRVIAAAGASMYTPNATAVAAALTAPERRGRAISVVIGGLTVATALGVPIGSWIGGSFSWRATLWLVAALGAVALISVAAIVPAVHLPAPARLRDRLMPLRDTTIATGLLHAVLLFGGMFTVYTYLAAAMHPATGDSTGRFTILLWVYGFTAVVGSTLGGRLVDRLGSRKIMPFTLIGAIVVLALVQASGQHFPTAIAWCIAFGIPGWIWAVAQQHRLVELSPQGSPLLLGLNASAQYFGIALGGAAGGLGVQWWGAGSLGWIGAILVVVSLGLLTLSFHDSARGTAGAAADIALTRAEAA